MFEVFIREVDLGRLFSSQARSSSSDALFWLADRFTDGMEWYIIVRKHPRRLENLNRPDGCLNVRFWVIRLSQVL